MSLEDLPEQGHLVTWKKTRLSQITSNYSQTIN